MLNKNYPAEEKEWKELFSCSQCSVAVEADTASSAASGCFCWQSAVIFVICAFSEFAFLPWSVHLHATVRALPACGTPCSWGAGSRLSCLLCPVCTAPAHKHQVSKAWPLDSTRKGGARCDGGSYGVRQLQSSLPPSPCHSCPFHIPFKYQLYNGDPLQVV